MIKNILPVHDFNYNTGRVKIFHANKGEGLPRHEHTYAHVTFCMAGACVIRKENKEVVVDRFTTPIELVANEWHEIEATEDNSVFCNVLAEENNY